MIENPYEAGESLPEGDPPSKAPLPGPPRVWPIPIVLLASLVTFLAMSVLSVGMAAVLVHGPEAARQLGAGGLEKILESRLGVAVTMLVPQIGLVVPVLVAACLSREQLAQRLGLVRGQWPLIFWLIAAAATPAVGMISSLIVGNLIGESKTLDEMGKMFRQLSGDGFLIPLALLVGLTPGICEELLFRGYVQKRLVERWGGLVGIGLASVVFAVFHWDLVHSTAVLAIGVYLGWIAMRSGSILPAMLAHFLNNFFSVIVIGVLPDVTPGQLPSDLQGVPLGAMLGVVLTMLLSLACLPTIFLMSWYFGGQRRQ